MEMGTHQIYILKNFVLEIDIRCHWFYISVLRHFLRFCYLKITISLKFHCWIASLIGLSWPISTCLIFANLKFSFFFIQDWRKCLITTWPMDITLQFFEMLMSKRLMESLSRWWLNLMASKLSKSKSGKSRKVNCKRHQDQKNTLPQQDLLHQSPWRVYN